MGKGEEHDLMQMNPDNIESATLRRLIEEVRMDGRTESAGYNRMHNRHNRSYHRYVPNNTAAPHSKRPLATGHCSKGGKHEPYKYRDWNGAQICYKCDNILRDK